MKRLLTALIYTCIIAPSYLNTTKVSGTSGAVSYSLF